MEHSSNLGEDIDLPYPGNIIENKSISKTIPVSEELAPNCFKNLNSDSKIFLNNNPMKLKPPWEQPANQPNVFNESFNGESVCSKQTTRKNLESSPMKKFSGQIKKLEYKILFINQKKWDKNIFASPKDMRGHLKQTRFSQNSNEDHLHVKENKVYNQQAEFKNKFQSWGDVEQKNNKSFCLENDSGIESKFYSFGVKPEINQSKIILSKRSFDKFEENNFADICLPPTNWELCLGEKLTGAFIEKNLDKISKPNSNVQISEKKYSTKKQNHQKDETKQTTSANFELIYAGTSTQEQIIEYLISEARKDFLKAGIKMSIESPLRRTRIQYQRPCKNPIPPDNSKNGFQKFINSQIHFYSVDKEQLKNKSFLKGTVLNTFIGKYRVSEAKLFEKYSARIEKVVLMMIQKLNRTPQLSEVQKFMKLINLQVPLTQVHFDSLSIFNKIKVICILFFRFFNINRLMTVFGDVWEEIRIHFNYKTHSKMYFILYYCKEIFMLSISK